MQDTNCPGGDSLQNSRVCAGASRARKLIPLLALGSFLWVTACSRESLEDRARRGAREDLDRELRRVTGDGIDEHERRIRKGNEELRRISEDMKQMEQEMEDR